MRSALDEVAAHNQTDQRSQAITEMKARKLANTKTSISFGNDRVSLS